MKEQHIPGSLHIGHNLIVDGYLYARNYGTPVVGMFKDEESLKSALPRPRPGWVAIVGTNIPGSIWMVDEEGNWWDTGETGGGFTIVVDGDGGSGGALDEDSVKAWIKELLAAMDGCDCDHDSDGDDEKGSEEDTDPCDGKYMPITGGTFEGNVNPRSDTKLTLGSDDCPWGWVHTDELHSSQVMPQNESDKSKIGTSLMPFKTAYIETVYSNDNQKISDSQEKDDIVALEGLTLETIAEAPAVSFTWKNSGGRSVGTIAQYWKERFPAIVKESDEGRLTMAYDNLSVVSAIVLAREIKDLRRRVAELEQRASEK